MAWWVWMIIGSLSLLAVCWMVAFLRRRARKGRKSGYTRGLDLAEVAAHAIPVPSSSAVRAHAADGLSVPHQGFRSGGGFGSKGFGTAATGKVEAAALAASAPDPVQSLNEASFLADVDSLSEDLLGSLADVAEGAAGAMEVAGEVAGAIAEGVGNLT